MTMKKLTFKLPLAYLATIAAVVSALSWPGARPVGAQVLTGREKVSADLRQKLSLASKVNVVIKSAKAWNKTLDDAVKSNGGAVTKSYASFPLRAATLPAAAVEALAARADVDYVALD